MVYVIRYNHGIFYKLCNTINNVCYRMLLIYILFYLDKMYQFN